MISIDPLEAFYARVATDTTLKGLMASKASGDAAWFTEFPDTVLEQDQYPRGTYFQVSGADIGVSAAELLVQADVWVWPTGTNGGIGRLNAIDQRLQQLLDSPEAKGSNGVQWTHGTGRVFSRSVDWRDPQTATDEPLRRRRLYRLRVS